ncbi:MAG: hypothetical protein K2X47_03280, partial [Bdellovibrionales bacterium]|nr:hypothetical protein [Bdellovibrionales bacterium]
AEFRMTLAPQLIADQFLKLGRTRNSALFTQFLPQGYSLVELSCVSLKFRDQARHAKLILGSFITLIDDMADDPEYRDANTLGQIYSFRFVTSQEPGSPEKYASIHGTPFIDFAKSLQRQFYESLKELPHFHELKAILDTELTMVFLANQLSEIQQDLDAITLEESQSLGPYNMGMTAAGIIDLMASAQPIPAQQLPLIRHIFRQGQRHGRISNLLSTYEREIHSGDRTSEISIANRDGHSTAQYRSELLRSLEEVRSSILQTQIEIFDVQSYTEGLRHLHTLHMKMSGTI